MRLISFVILLWGFVSLAQEDNTRQLWNQEFMQKRPAGKTAPKAAMAYRPLGPPQAPSVAGSGTMVGVTLWKLRPAKASDDSGKRLLVLVPNGAKKTEEVPERVDPKSDLATGDHFRLTIEVPASGFLYVIDREQFKNGTMSAPYLIYPNWQTHPGDNVVAPGRLIEIPDRRDKFNAFELQPSRPDQVTEVISLLVSPEPIPGLKIGDEPLKLDPAVYAGWEKKWGVQAEQFELVGGPGQTWTDKEKQAGEDHATALTQEDALPQTLYRLNAKPGNAVLVQVPLKIKH